MRTIALALFLGSLGTCASRSSSEAPRVSEQGADEPASPEVAPEVSRGGCRTGECWQARADEAERLGALDVAAAHRGRAHALEPGGERLFAYVDALVAAGGLRRARAALDEARAAAARAEDRDLVARIDARISTWPESQVDVASDVSEPLRRAYESEFAGRLDDAAREFEQALVGPAAPVHLVHAGELQRRRGDDVAARRLWSRARTRLDELGAAIELVAVETWFTSQVLWRGDGLALVRRYTPVYEHAAGQAGALELVRAGPGLPLVRRLRFATPPGRVAFSADGRTLVRDEEGALVFQDMSSGTVLRRIEKDGSVRAFAVVGSGDAMLVLAAHERETVLWSAAGEPLQRFVLTGTTPTITRVYTGEGSYHENILEDSPTWPVSLALSADASLVAIGGSDSKVRLFDRRGGPPRELAFAWKYTERRHRGGNPDLNLPLALRFSGDGRQLVAVHTHGDVLHWDTRTGAMRKRIAPTCTAEEAALHVSRHDEPGAPVRPATREEREDCGGAGGAALSPDAALAVTGGGLRGLRLRDARTGAPRGYHVADDLPDQHLDVSAAGEVVAGDIYGAVAVVAPGGAPRALAPKGRSGPTQPWLSSDGRVFAQFSAADPVFVWDLVARRPLELARGPKERVLALSPTAARVAVHTGDAVELRDVAGGGALARVPTRAAPISSRVQFASTSGHVLIDTSDDRGRRFELVELPAGARRPLKLDERGAVLLSGDGRHVATWRRDAPLTIVRAATGEVVASLDEGVHRVAFAPDGAFVVWLLRADGDRPGGVVRARWLEGQGPKDIRETRFDDWETALVVAGDEALVLSQHGALLGWNPATGARAERKADALVAALGVVRAVDGKHLIFPGYNQISVRADDPALTERLRLVALLSGGWLAIAPSRAMDGSDDAPEHLLARVRSGDEAFAASGRLAWDAVHVPGLVARALAGEDVEPPLRLMP